MRLQQVTTIILIILLIGCGGGVETAAQYYNGVPLPSPEPIKGFPTQPPSAWLLTKAGAIPTTFGSFCYQGGCADMAPPQLLPHLSSASISAGDRPIIVIVSQSVKRSRAHVGSWTTAPSAPLDPATTRDVQVEEKPDGSFTVLTLAPLNDTHDLILAIEVTFGEGEAIYLWRLHL